MRILIVDDHGPMRAALHDLLRLHYPFAALLEAADGQSALQLADAYRPHLVVLDLRLPDGNGLELIGPLRAAAPGCAVVVLSQHSASAYVERSLAAGAAAFVAKDAVQRALLPAIRTALGQP